jgi:hypothetical protein
MSGKPKILPVITDIVGLDFKELMIKYLNKTMKKGFGNEPYFNEAL